MNTLVFSLNVTVCIFSDPATDTNCAPERKKSQINKVERHPLWIFTVKKETFFPCSGWCCWNFFIFSVCLMMTFSFHFRKLSWSFENFSNEKSTVLTWKFANIKQEEIRNEQKKRRRRKLGEEEKFEHEKKKFVLFFRSFFRCTGKCINFECKSSKQHVFQWFRMSFRLKQFSSQFGIQQVSEQVCTFWNDEQIRRRVCSRWH